MPRVALDSLEAVLVWFVSSVTLDSAVLDSTLGPAEEERAVEGRVTVMPRPMALVIKSSSQVAARGGLIWST